LVDSTISSAAGLEEIHILQLIRFYRIMNLRHNYPTKESSNC
jgi:hypothetical protein